MISTSNFVWRRKKSVARISPPIMFLAKSSFHLFAFLLSCLLSFHFIFYSLQPYRFPILNFSAILSLALRDRGIAFYFIVIGTITLLFTRRKGVCTFPKKSCVRLAFYVAGLHDVFHHAVFQ